jgi:hypothetical protein
VIKVVDLDQVGRPARQLSVTESVDVQLRPRYILGLRSLGRLEVDDDDLFGVGSPNEIDATVHDKTAT